MESLGVSSSNGICYINRLPIELKTMTINCDADDAKKAEKLYSGMTAVSIEWNAVFVRAWYGGRPLNMGRLFLDYFKKEVTSGQNPIS
jgi:hypothetical protein